MMIQSKCLVCNNSLRKLIQVNETLLDHLNSIMSVQIKPADIENKGEQYLCEICISIVEDFYELKSIFIRNFTALMNLYHFDDMDILSFEPRAIEVFRFWNSFSAKERQARLDNIREPADSEVEESILEEKTLRMLQKEQKVKEHVVDVVEVKQDINRLPPNLLSTKTDMDELELLTPINIDLAGEDDQPAVKPTEIIMYECRYCPFSGYNRRKVTIHEKSCRKRKRSRSRSRSALSYTCAECYTSETFPSSSDLKKHVTDEHRQKHPCRLCSKVYDTVNERSWHEAECCSESEPNGVRTRSSSRLSKLKKDDDEQSVRSQSSMSCYSVASSTYSKKSGKSTLSTKSARSMKSYKQRGQSYNHPNVPPPVCSTSYRKKDQKRSEYREPSITPEPVKVVKQRRSDWKPASSIIKHQVFKKKYDRIRKIFPLRMKSPTLKSKIKYVEPTTVENRFFLFVRELNKIKEKPHYMEYGCLEPKCEFVTDCLITLTKHDIVTHKSLPYFMCPECQQSFTKSTYLKWHKASKHASSPLFCHRCYNIFQSSHELAFHLRTHNVKRYPCTICEVEYSDNASLLYHWKVANDKSHKKHFEKQNRVTNMCIPGSDINKGYMAHTSPNSSIKLYEQNGIVKSALEVFSAPPSRCDSRNSDFAASRCDSRNSDFAISEVMSLSGVSSGASTPLHSSEFYSDDEDDDGASTTSSKRSAFSTRPSTPFPSTTSDNINGIATLFEASEGGDPIEDISMTFENQFMRPVFKDNQLVNEPYEPPVAGCSYSN